MPDEARPKEHEPFQLVASQSVVERKIRDALETDDGAWPEWQLLWEQHPLVEWLLDSLVAAYARHEAPLIVAPKLGTNEALFLFSTLVSNEDSQPVHTAWFSVPCEGYSLGAGVWSLEETLARTGFAQGLSNPHGEVTRREGLQRLVPRAVAVAREQVEVQRKPALDELRKTVRRETRRLQNWQTRVEALIDARAERYRRGQERVPAHLEKRLRSERENLARFRDNHEQWLKSLAAHGSAYIRLAAVFTGA